MSKILVVDDDAEVTSTIEEVLTGSGFIVDVAATANDAQAMLAGFVYDLIILDWLMPEMQGIDFLAMLRARHLTTPVLMVTGMNQVENKVRGFETGADDYLTKPFNRQELLARVRAILRRPQAMTDTELRLSGVSLDTRTLRVTWLGKEIKLTKQEYQLLELLMRHKNEVFTHDALVQRAWSSLSEASPDTVRTHMARLRKKFEDGPMPCPLRTVHGQGYVFVSEEK